MIYFQQNLSQLENWAIFAKTKCPTERLKNSFDVLTNENTGKKSFLILPLDLANSVPYIIVV